MSINNFDTTTNEGWINEFAFQYRLRGATGEETGSAMAEIEAHLADSGEPASEAFGDPRDYAATLLPHSRREGAGTWVGSVFVGVAAFLAFGLISDAVRHWGGEVPILTSWVISIALMAVMVAVLTMFSSAILGSRKMWGLIVWLVLAFVAMVLPALFVTGAVGAIPATLALAIALALIAGALFYLFRLVNDPIRDPRTADLVTRERGLVAAGRDVEAMKAYRKRTRATLAQAKAVIDAAKAAPRR